MFWRLWDHQVCVLLHRLFFAHSAAQSGAIAWFEEQVPRKREKRLTITDPDYPKQWHLHGDASTGHLNIVPVWDQGTLIPIFHFSFFIFSPSSYS
jgi:hypothetical protein